MDEKEMKNKAALYLLQFHNNQINYFSNILNRYKDNEKDWTIIQYEMAVKLNRICVEELEKWINEQKFDYEQK